jgi:hypothetical protein
MTIRDVARRLPGILQLRDCSQALAMLDAILCPKRWLRYHSFDTHWGPDQLATALNCHRTRRNWPRSSTVSGIPQRLGDSGVPSQNELDLTTIEASSAAGLGS